MRLPVVRAVWCMSIVLVFAASFEAPVEAQWTWKSAKEQGIDLPKRLGFELTLYDHRQDYELDSLEVTLPGFDPSQARDLDVRNHTETPNLVVDYWLLPFLNINARIGTVDGQTLVGVADIDLPLPVPLSNLIIDYDGLVYGAGLLLAGGWDRYFGSLDFHLNRTNLDVSTSEVEAWLTSGRFGLKAGGGAIWIGAQYQRIDERHEGTLDIPFLGTVGFDVTLNNSDPWNFLIGGRAPLSDSFTLSLEGGFGDRQAVIFSLGYRLGS